MADGVSESDESRGQDCVIAVLLLRILRRCFHSLYAA